MKSPIRFALIDCNNFYCSCESVFDPTLRGRPIVVLSNNDGCCVARSAESKVLGIRMAEPWHLVQQRPGMDAVVALSSNYELYGDMSTRVMRIIADYSAKSEVYSIDECFSDVTGISDLRSFGLEIRERLLSWVGLPTCIGIGSTKTRSKLANHWAKKHPEHQGVFDLESLSTDNQNSLLESLPVSEVWGVGRRLTPKLAAMGIRTVRELRDSDPKHVRACFSVVMEKTVKELNGVSCIALEMIAPAQRQIMCSRSFGREVTTFDELRQAVITYISRAGEKLRNQQALAGSLMIFAHTNPFKDTPQYSRTVTLHLPDATDDTLILARYAAHGLRQIWKDGFKYKKAGTMLLNLQPAAMRQATLLDDPAALARRARLNGALDRVNARYGRGALVVAGAGVGKGWKMQRQTLTPQYTTRWDHLPVAL